MSHAYHLRPNAKGRLQRRLNAHVAAFGEQNWDKITAMPSKTGQGVHLHFDPERSLSPDPDHHQSANADRERTTESTEEGVIIIDDCSDSEDSSSGLASDQDTVAPDTPSPRGGQLWPPSSKLRAPTKAAPPRHAHWPREGSVAPSITTSSAHDSMAQIAERRQALLNAHLYGADVHGRRHAEDERRIADLRRDYEGRIEQFRQQNADIFGLDIGFEEGAEDAIAMAIVGEYYSPPTSPVFSHHPLPQSAGGPSRSGARMQEGRRQALRRHGAQQFIVPQERDMASASEAADGQFVVVARRVPKLGPCGTVVINHETGEQILEKRRYRVRAEELQSIDGDGDSVMGSDD
ncbi:hypothetical protein DFH94DRAFT_743474 [Russula ochroleuca]|jgi:hypothetical protein|uniref:Uncharacterized protein n=1 Tax=Russula ochroleuca TaxID=152965 RepID=A0A9P5T979_9AGAM|nr:hypothetical protein DFH94DRAFT_743474 [Russula ochroleuca]